MPRKRAPSLTIAACLAASLWCSTAQAQGGERLLPLSVIINNSPGGEWVLLEKDGMLYAPEDAFVEWRLTRAADTQPIEHRGMKWIPLSAASGYESKYNFADQAVELTFSPSSFEATRLAKARATRPELTPTLPALFLNYDLSYTAAAYRDAPGYRSLGALTELGLSAYGGVLTSSHVGQGLFNSDPNRPGSWRRLETTYSHDFPDSNTTLKLGDASTRRTTWARTIYFGGIQFARNFALTPGFISQPLPAISGIAGAPSTMELYVNDVLRQSSGVPTGPFTIDNFPLLTSSGDARIVVRDVLGRETVIEQSFFSHARLLEQGLSDWSGEIGAVRNNLGSSNADYGQRFASGMLRHGINKELTVEAQGEWGQTTRDAGLGAQFKLPWLALGQMALSASHDDATGGGNSLMLGFEKSSLRHVYTTRIERATRGYRQVGQTVASPRSQISASYTHTPADFSGSFSLSAADMRFHDNPHITTLSGNYSQRVFKNGSLVFSASRAFGASFGYSFGASLLLPLDDRTNLSGNVSNRSGQVDSHVSATKSMRGENGTSWRALSGTRGGYGYAEGGMYLQGSKGLLTGDLSTSAAQQTLRLGAQGGIVAMDGHTFMTRRVQESFAVVEVPGYADVGITFQNSILARTDQDGVALLPRLLPYQRNSIRLDPTELPISAEVDSIEQIAVPAARSGVKVSFPVRSGRGALISVRLEDGSTVPAGTTVEVVGDREQFYVGRRGEVFATGLREKNILRLDLNGTSCMFEVVLPPQVSPDDITRIGPLTCTPAAMQPEGGN